jgi:ABC-type nitrate/sulfonate/bicarbonate transport system permease component
VLGVNYYPTPEVVAHAFMKDFLSGDLFSDAGISFLRLVVSWFISIPLGMCLGFFIGKSPIIKKLLLPTISALKAIPIVAAFPLIIMTFGMTEKAAIFIIVFTSIVPIIVATVDGVSDAFEKYNPLIKNLELGFFASTFKVLIPAAMSTIFSSIDASVSISLRMLILAEIMGVPSGIGYRIMEATQFVDFGRMYYLLLFTAAVGILVTMVYASIRKRILVWM